MSRIFDVGPGSVVLNQAQPSMAGTVIGKGCPPYDLRVRWNNGAIFDELAEDVILTGKVILVQALPLSGADKWFT
jgi:hypothetical protein